MDHYDHSKKNSEILSIFNFIFTEFNSHANKNPSYTSFLYFFHFNVKSTSYKIKQILHLCKLLETKPVK